jgi:uncharacterized protein YaaN involved in tellurite resistance
MSPATPTAATQAQAQPLAAVTQEQVKQDLSLTPEKEAPADPALDKKAQDFVDQLMKFNANDQNSQDATKSAVENMGLDLQREAASQSKMLQDPVKKLAKRSEDGSEVANALIDLKMQVEDLDPAKLDMDAGWFSRMVGHVPGVGAPLKRYFTRYESAQTVINAIIGSLENGRDQLKRDNLTLTEDQKRMRETTLKLTKTIALGQLVDQKLQGALDNQITQDDPKYKFIQEELLFPLRQRIIDLQQQLAVNQQGVLSTELIIRNNQELVRGVNRALNVTVSALQVAVTVAMALADQRIVLDKINALGKTTDSLIAGTAARLKTQGAEIHKQASTAQLDIQTLKTAFQDIKAAMDDIAQFRANALPQMASSILEMDKVTKEAEDRIQKVEEADRTRPSMNLEI